MKIARMIGLAAIAALALMAFAGASQALAAKTVLCKSPGSCASGNEYPSGTAIKATSSSVEIKQEEGYVPIKCSGSTLEGKTTAASGEPLGAEITAWTLSGCKQGATNCTVTTEHLPYSATIAYDGSIGGNGTIAVKGSGGAEVGWHIVCLVNCVFSFNPTLTAEGGNPAHLSIAQQTLNKSGLCIFTTPTFVAAPYTVNAPQPMYVVPAQLAAASSGTVFCDMNEEPCGPGGVYPSGTEFSAALVPGTSLTIEEEGQNSITCSSSSFSGHTTATSGESQVEEKLPASITSFTVAGCENPFGGPCVFTAENLPYATKFDARTKYPLFKKMQLSGLALHCETSTGINCTYSSADLWFKITGGGPPTLSVYQELRGTGALCFYMHPILHAQYRITSPSLLYVVLN